MKKRFNLGVHGIFKFIAHTREAHNTSIRQDLAGSVLEPESEDNVAAINPARIFLSFFLHQTAAVWLVLGHLPKKQQQRLVEIAFGFFVAGLIHLAFVVYFGCSFEHFPEGGFRLLRAKGDACDLLKGTFKLKLIYAKGHFLFGDRSQLLDIFSSSPQFSTL